MSLTATEKKEIVVVVRKEIKDFFGSNTMQQYENKLIDDFKKYNLVFDDLEKGFNGPFNYQEKWGLIYVEDKLPQRNKELKEAEGIKTPWHRTTLLTLAITLHNIPEGLAIGVLFGGVAAGIPEASITGAVVLAIGIGIQNFPEGIAVSMPLRRQGMSRWKSFMYGQASAAVEPIAAVIGAVAVTFFTPILPYALAFAAGAMIFVVVEEVIPETQLDKNTDIATLGFIGGFIVMMILDVALG